MRPHGIPEDLQRRRQKAVELLNQGYQPVEVAERLGVDRRSVRRWRRAYRQNGRKGIEAKPTPGRPPKLRPDESKRMEKILLKGARAAGFPTDLWTCARVTRVIKQRFGVDYHLCHVWRLLRSLGWSCQKPARRAVERDKALIEQWVKVQWPALKKSP